MTYLLLWGGSCIICSLWGGIMWSHFTFSMLAGPDKYFIFSMWGGNFGIRPRSWSSALHNAWRTIYAKGGICVLYKRGQHFSFVQTKDRMVITKNHHLRALGSCTAQVGLSCKNSSYYSNVSLAWFAISIKSPAAFFHLALLNKTQSHKVVRSSSTVFGLLKLIPTMVIF